MRAEVRLGVELVEVGSGDAALLDQGVTAISGGDFDGTTCVTCLELLVAVAAPPEQSGKQGSVA
jgi:hypothetical protein